MSRTKEPAKPNLDTATRGDVRTVVEFFRSIGLAVKPKSGAIGFVPGIEIENGTLFIDKGSCLPGDLLHEAGHLAVLPSLFRRQANTDLDVVMETMGEYLSADATGGENTLSRAILQSGECEATAWAWAAGMHLGLPANVIIQPKANMDGDDEGAPGIRLALSANSYFGINGLQAAGWCAVRGGAYAKALGLPVYPNLAFWLQG